MAKSDDIRFVKQVQNLLNRAGYGLAVDGIPGPKTQAAIRDFQEKNGLPVNGLATRTTMNALFKVKEGVPKPNLRPEGPDVLGTGKTGMPLPTTRQQGLLGVASAPNDPQAPQTAAMAPQQEWMPGAYQRDLAETRQQNPQANLNPAYSGIHPGTMFDMTYGRTFAAADLARERGVPYPDREPPPAPPLPPFGQGLTPPPLPQIPRTGAMGAPQQPPAAPQQPQKPPFQPDAMNPGYGAPGMPRREGFGEAVGDVFGAAGGGIQSLIQSLFGGGGQQQNQTSYEQPKSSPVDDALTIAIKRDMLRKRLAEELARQQMTVFGMETK